MANVQIRKSVFETNSSSSHSLTMGKAELVAQPFPADVLRGGVLELRLGDYGWEYRRYYTATEKLRYLLTQMLSHKQIWTLEPADLTQRLCEEDERMAMLVRVVKDHTGCELRVVHSRGGIDHDSEGVGMELFNNEETLRNFLFDETACVETSNDNSPGPWRIETDKGDELYYAPFIREVPAAYVEVTLKKVGRYGLEAFGTQGGGLVSEDQTPALFAELCKHGIATAVHYDCVESQDPFEYRDATGEGARLVLGYGEEPFMGVSRSFVATHSFTQEWDYAKRREDVTITVRVPLEVAQEMDKLAPGGVTRFYLDHAQRQLQYWTERAAEKDAAGTPEQWAVKQVEQHRLQVEKLSAELQAQLH